MGGIRICHTYKEYVIFQNLVYCQVLSWSCVCAPDPDNTQYIFIVMYFKKLDKHKPVR